MAYKTVAATELKNRLGDYLGAVIHGHEPVLIERHGKPVAVLVDYEKWKRLREEKSVKIEDSWIVECRELVERIKKNHPHVKQTSAVELVRQIREEES